MAYCPKCNGEMLATAIACSHCGHDFPKSANPKIGLRYSLIADIALCANGLRRNRADGTAGVFWGEGVAHAGKSLETSSEVFVRRPEVLQCP